jgi:hypothetical protein
MNRTTRTNASQVEVIRLNPGSFKQASSVTETPDDGIWGIPRPKSSASGSNIVLQTAEVRITPTGGQSIFSTNGAGQALPRKEPTTLTWSHQEILEESSWLEEEEESKRYKGPSSGSGRSACTTRDSRRRIHRYTLFSCVLSRMWYKFNRPPQYGMNSTTRANTSVCTPWANWFEPWLATEESIVTVTPSLGYVQGMPPRMHCQAR